MHSFRAAIEARDIAAAVALLSDNVVLRSPVVFKPYQRREAVEPILHAVSRVFEDFRYVREIGSEDAAHHALVSRRASETSRWRDATSSTSTTAA